MFFCANNAASKLLFCHLYFCMKNWKTTQYNLSKNVSFSFSVFFVFLLLSYNSLHVMPYIYICYWNTFEYKYITQITFHVKKTKQKKILLILSTLRRWIFQWALSWKLITWAKCVTLTILTKTPRKIDKYFLFGKSNTHKNFCIHLKHFLTFLLFISIEK